MTAVPAPAKVLVTGASGFLAAHIVANLLVSGYTVVGTVRSQSKGDYLVNLFANYTGKFSFIIVSDVEKPGAFDEAVKGIDAVIHTASPFHLAADDPNEIIRPAAQGTVGILQSIQRFAPSVKRVVATSSVAALAPPKPAGYVYTEEDWNDDSPAIIDKLGSKAPNFEKYRASKSLAERAAWEFVEKNKDWIAFDLVTICPPFIYGPPIHEIKDISALNESLAGFRRAIEKVPSQEGATAYIGNSVDVRDVAATHTRAIQVEEAGGERFLPSSGPFSWQDFYDTLREVGVLDIPEGYPGTQDRAKYYLQDGSKTTRVLGIKYKTFQETAVDTINSLRTRFPGSC